MNLIRAYSGIEPYCFISYAHLDIEIISER